MRVAGRKWISDDRMSAMYSCVILVVMGVAEKIGGRMSIASDMLMRCDWNASL